MDRLEKSFLIIVFAVCVLGVFGCFLVAFTNKTPKELYRTEYAIVVSVDSETGLVTLKTDDGKLWEYHDEEDIDFYTLAFDVDELIGQKVDYIVRMRVRDNSTPNDVTDDVIWSAYLDHAEYRDKGM